MTAATVDINRALAIPLSQITFHASRSSGPGGQHVNRVNSRVELRFDVGKSPTLTDIERRRLLQGLRSHLDKDGVVHLFVQTHRSQARNRETALRRFQSLCRRALRPRKRRAPTRPSRASVERRLASKRRRGEQKQRRRKPGLEE